MTAPDPTAGAKNGQAAFPFRRRHRISHARDFERAFRQGVRKVQGPIAVFGVPNHLPHARLGLSIGRRFGGAVQRSRIKRLIREAFRVSAPDMPPGYDLVVTVRPHKELPFEEYTRRLRECWRAIDRDWRRRAADAPKDECS